MVKYIVTSGDLWFKVNCLQVSKDIYKEKGDWGFFFFFRFRLGYKPFIVRSYWLVFWLLCTKLHMWIQQINSSWSWYRKEGKKYTTYTRLAELSDSLVKFTRVTIESFVKHGHYSERGWPEAHNKQILEGVKFALMYFCSFSLNVRVWS